MAFWTYNQNNSGGNFAHKENAISQYVIIEAATDYEADGFAEEIGIYFDGVETGWDCDCCGDRWRPQWGDGDEAPSIHGDPVTEWVTTRSQFNFINWMGDNPDGYIHYLDGRVESFKKELD